MTETLVAYYFWITVTWQTWPVMFGPFETLDGCHAVEAFYKNNNYVTSGCGLKQVTVEDVEMVE